MPNKVFRLVSQEQKARCFPKINVAKIVLHKHPDLDAICALWLALRFGQDVLIGIKEAYLRGIEYWPQGPPPDGRTAQEHEAEGTICFDVGEGKRDHHPHSPEKQHVCATDLVARDFGISNDPALKSIIDYVHQHDLRGPGYVSRRLSELGVNGELQYKAKLNERFGFAVMAANQARRLKSNKRLIEWVFGQLDEYFEHQYLFWTEVKEDFLTNARIVFCPPSSLATPSRNQPMLKIAVIESTHRKAGSFSRTRDGGYCDLCIHRDIRTGFAYISGGNPSLFLEIGKVLRVLEMAKRGIVDVPYFPSELENSQFLPCRHWYMPKDEDGLVFVVMNSGEKGEGGFGIEPTILTTDEMLNGILFAANDTQLDSSCPRTHCFGSKCGYYPYGLARCQRIRQQTKTPQV